LKIDLDIDDSIIASSSAHRINGMQRGTAWTRRATPNNPMVKR
jgi:hypothetical protein